MAGKYREEIFILCLTILYITNINQIQTAPINGTNVTTTPAVSSTSTSTTTLSSTTAESSTSTPLTTTITTTPKTTTATQASSETTTTSTTTSTSTSTSTSTTAAPTKASTSSPTTSTTTTTTTTTTTSTTPTTSTSTVPTTASISSPTTTTTTSSTPTTTSTSTSTSTTTSTSPTTSTITSTTTTTATSTTTSTTPAIPSTTTTTTTPTTPTPTATSTSAPVTTGDPTTTPEVTLNLNNGFFGANEFVFCSPSIDLCKNGGICYQNTSSPSSRFCQCQGDYYGETCESESEEGFKKALYGVVLLAAILLMISVVTSCQLYIRKGDLENVKQEKHEMEVFYQRKLGNSRTSTFNDNASSVGGISIKDMDISQPENTNYLIAATTALKEKQEEEKTGTENKRQSVVIEIADEQPITVQDRRYRSRSLDSDISLSYYYDAKDSGAHSDAETNSIHSQRMLIPPSSRPKSWCGSEAELAAINGYNNPGLQISDDDVSPRISPNTSLNPYKGHMTHQRYQDIKNNRQRYIRSKSPNYPIRPKSTSLGDLRVAAINGNMRSPSRENLSIPIQNQHGQRRKKGIWASSQERLNDLRDSGMMY